MYARSKHLPLSVFRLGRFPSSASRESGCPLASRRDNEDLWIQSNKIKIVMTEDAHASVQDTGV